MKLKTHKATAKRIKITKNKKAIRRSCGQDHFNARDQGKVTRSKRKNHTLSRADQKKILKLIPNY